MPADRQPLAGPSNEVHIPYHPYARTAQTMQQQGFMIQPQFQPQLQMQPQYQEIQYQPQPYQPQVYVHVPQTPVAHTLPMRPSPEVTTLASQLARQDVKPVFDGAGNAFVPAVRVGAGAGAGADAELKPDIKPLLDLKPNIHTVVAPLPSKRAKLQSTSKAQLIPVDQLPVFPLPPLPDIPDPELKSQVFSHSSLFSKVKGRFEMVEETDYEKLEHVGDSILGMVITTWLHETKPLLTIGTATKLKSHLVSNNTLAHISQLYGLPARLNGDPAALPVIRAQTDIRAALVEAYIAALYFSFPPSTRAAEGWAAVDRWLRELYEPLYDFYYNYMKREYDQHHTATGAGADGVIINSPEMAIEDAKSQGMAALLGMYCGKRGLPLVYREERLETNVGVLWKVKVDVAGTEMAEATRASKKVAKNVGAWNAAKGLGIAE